MKKVTKLLNPLESEFNVSEIFYSIQGEGTRAGMPCVFVRLQGCELRCKWCDTPYALQIKQKELILTGNDIFKEISAFKCNFVTITGGEPLLQKNIKPFVRFLIDAGYTVSIETNGHQSLRGIDKRAIKIVDFKLPSSGMTDFNNFQNLNYLHKHDEIKFVIVGETDYEWAKSILSEHSLHLKVDAVIFSPVFGSVEPSKLAEWILRDNIPVRLQIQLHKHIWEPSRRGV